MVRMKIRSVKPKAITSWSAGGQIIGKKPSRASVLRYLKAIEKRDGITHPRLKE